jgi:hypothetical protein
MLCHARQVQQQREARSPFDEGADSGALEAEDEVALPMTGHGPIVGFGGSFADENLVGDEALGACSAAPSGRGVRDRCASKR